MNKISKLEKELERREISEAGLKRKVKENYSRAFMNLLPNGSKLEKFVFGLVDARRAQAIDDTLNMLVEELGDLRMSKLKLSTDFDLAKAELDSLINDKNAFEDKYISMLDEVGYLNTEIKSELDEQKRIALDTNKEVKDSASRMRQMEKKLDAFLDTHRWRPDAKLPGSSDFVLTSEAKTLSKEDLLVKLGDELINNVSSMIEEGELNAAYKIIEGIVEAENFETLDVQQKIDLISMKGDILVKKGEKKNAKEVCDKLLEYGEHTKRKVDLLHYYSSVFHDKQLFNLAISVYQEMGLSKTEMN